MQQADEANTSIRLTKKGERALAAQAAARALAITEKRRILQEAGEQVDRLLGIIDRLAGDPDLELTGDEADANDDPEFSLGWTGVINQTSRNRLGDLDHHFGDRELDRCDDEDGGDKEPSIGGLGIGASGTDHWQDTDDLEGDPVDNGEQSLGWAGHVNQCSPHRLGDTSGFISEAERDDCDKEEGGELEPEETDATFSEDGDR